MVDEMPPSELVRARRDFLGAEAELSRVAAEAPNSLAADGSVVGIAPGLAARMDALRERMRESAELLAGHPWMTESGSWYAAWREVDAAAKAAE